MKPGPVRRIERRAGSSGTLGNLPCDVLQLLLTSSIDADQFMALCDYRFCPAGCCPSG